jgi:hypothetical protein
MLRYNIMIFLNTAHKILMQLNLWMTAFLDVEP